MPIRRFCPTSGDGWMMADLLRHVAILLVESDIFERLALNGNEYALMISAGRTRTSIGLNGLAIRPIVEE